MTDQEQAILKRIDGLINQGAELYSSCNSRSEAWIKGYKVQFCINEYDKLEDMELALNKAEKLIGEANTSKEYDMNHPNFSKALQARYPKRDDR